MSRREPPVHQRLEFLSPDRNIADGRKEAHSIRPSRFDLWQVFREFRSSSGWWL